MPGFLSEDLLGTQSWQGSFSQKKRKLIFLIQFSTFQNSQLQLSLPSHTSPTRHANNGLIRKEFRGP